MAIAKATLNAPPQNCVGIWVSKPYGQDLQNEFRGRGSITEVDPP